MVQVCFSLDPDLKKQIEEFAKVDNRSRSEETAILLKKAVENRRILLACLPEYGKDLKEGTI